MKKISEEFTGFFFLSGKGLPADWAAMCEVLDKYQSTIESRLREIEQHLKGPPQANVFESLPDVRVDILDYPPKYDPEPEDAPE